MICCDDVTCNFSVLRQTLSIPWLQLAPLNLIFKSLARLCTCQSVPVFMTRLKYFLSYKVLAG